jgi:phenylalanyl-tRNA synthetase beta chain
MKFSVLWLQEWLDSKIDAQALASKLTMSGLEIESLEPASGEFQGVVVGLIESEAAHPDAKRLHCCQVNMGEAKPLPIVCGGVNVRPGLKVAVATVGARLPGGIDIKQTVLRGEPSHGMICSARELELGDDKEGCILELPADAPIGADLREYLSLNDQVLDVALGANRGDCLSISGIAREVAALLKVKNRPLEIEASPVSIQDTLKVEVTAPQRCPRYTGRILRHINPNAQTPTWMRERLRRSGIRSIHPVVDITNYVMLELGQPLHAFNLENVSRIEVRMAKPGENLTLLDGRQLTLNAEDLVIAGPDQALALAGVMGGASSGVTAQTQDIFLESAFFSQIPLSLTARRHGLQTDSGYRYSRGVDYNLPSSALERATHLLMEITGAQAGPVIEVETPQHLPKPSIIFLRKEQIPRLLGIEFSDERVVEILQSLGMTVTAEQGGWNVKIPSHRYDLSLEADLIEELCRLNGYEHIPLQAMTMKMHIASQPSQEIPMYRFLSLLADRGYYEAITYSFVSSRWQEWLDPQQSPLMLANPISSDMNVMRTSLWPGLLQALQYNQNRQIPRVRLFETGLCFFPPQDEPRQIAMLSGVVSGDVYPEQWGFSVRPVDFFDVKADIEALLALSGQIQNYHWQPGEHPALHPGQNAELLYNDQVAGRLGALHPALVEKCGLSGPVYLFELNLNIIKYRQLNEFKNISKFPAVRRDIAVTVAQATPAAGIEKFIVEKAGKLLNNVQIFDVYQGQNIEKGQKSIALALVFQDESRTLKDDEIQAVVDYLIKGMEQEFNAKLRV